MNTLHWLVLAFLLAMFVAGLLLLLQGVLVGLALMLVALAILAGLRAE